MKGQKWLAGWVAVGFGALASVAGAQEPAGWVLNVEKSAFADNRQELRSALGSIPAQAGLMLASTGVAPRGHEGALVLQGDELSFEADVRFKARLDGRDYPIAGLPVGDTIAINVGDGDEVTSTIKSAGNKVASFRRSVSADERTMVLTARYFGSDGQVARERLVFERR
ncbi:MAG: hypothetical protein KJS95_12945 [Gammaproteobacteria bacterium]|nr:hypothetical protein [Gammaproteobacteria bacterium]